MKGQKNMHHIFKRTYPKNEGANKIKLFKLFNF